MSHTHYWAAIAFAGISFSSSWIAPVFAESALPEAVEIKLVNQLSDKLALKLTEANCPEFNEILDGAQADAANGDQGSSIINQVLEDVKTNPKLRTIVITKLGEPLLKRTLDCNLTPVGALEGDLTSIQDISQLSAALTEILSTSDCPAFNQILDEAQASADKLSDDESLAGVNQILAQAKTTPESQTLMINQLGNPLLSKILDCNLVPFDALR